MMATLVMYSSFIPTRNGSYTTSTTASSFRNNIITAKSSSTNIFQHLTKKLPNQTPKSPLMPRIFHAVDEFICDVLDLPLPRFLDPKYTLSGNFTPVGEIPPTACDVVEGSLPSCLHGGAYIRNGPNPHFTPKGPYHFFDGDGMLHMIKFSPKPTFCCRFVNTHKYAVEREMGYPFVPSIFSCFNGGLFASFSRFLLTATRIISGHFDPINHGFGTANTNLALVSGHLFALCESDLPYAISITADGDITTLGRHHFGASEPFPRMTAHPKVDRLTGEAFAYAYDVVPPFLKLFRIDSNGRKQKDVPIFSIKKLTVIHDIAVTEKYAVIPDMQMVVKPSLILSGRSPVQIDEEKVARVGVIPRYAEDEEEMVWIDAPGFNPLHCVNAWEEDGGDTVCMVASNALAVDQLLENLGCSQLKMEKIVINVKAKTVQRHSLSPEILEFAVINPAYAAKKNRYIYAAVITETRAVGVVKLDLSLLNKEDAGDCTVASCWYGPDCHGGEPFFVAREANNPAAEEDDGYLVTYLHDDNCKESKLVVMDAKSATLDIIAAVKLPQRVPTGFHGLFLSQTDLTKI
ncbi:probable carotenoid cleavage dioxygenase 4, chloroplastic [Salvia miltiorrhiza]|uniref:probable carotenoid cleavage dioxygenase 4, chloroplastic n=1 Tax=Salvia miltiorrhiza TaxID=226208 RepID=UPI0025ACA934|nr:probable carotenoid cleavage dioxygenase 4, chloroplastic [Salvia miltiorrhiza]